MRRLAILVPALLVSACAGTPAQPPAAPAQPAAPPPVLGASAEATPAPAPPAEVHLYEVTPPDAPPSFTLHAADVGTGLALFVEGPDFTLVYDAGSNDDLATGEGNRFVAYLKATRPDLKKIDHVLLSHPHRDHVELLADVLTTYQVGAVWDSGAVNPVCGYRRFVEAVATSGATYHTAANSPGAHKIDFGKVVCTRPKTATVQHGTRITDGMKIPLGKNASMTVLHADGVTHANANENSLVVRLDLAGTRVLLVGDSEAGGRADPLKAPTAKSVEGLLLANHRDDLDADVLVAGHHGSKSSSRKEFIEAVSPKLSIISSGPTKYATVVLPDQEVVDELTKAGTLIRTDVDDAKCATNPKKIGVDADGRPGGCTNIRVTIEPNGVVTGSVWNGHD